MAVILPQRLQFAAWLTAVVAVLAVSVGTPWYVARMAADHAGHGMVGCPLMFDSAAICPMRLADHIAVWRSLLTAVSPQVAGSFLLAVVLSCLPWWLALLRRWLLGRQKLRATVDWLRNLHQHPQAIFHGALQWAFARGILHPKIYPAVNG